LRWNTKFRKVGHRSDPSLLEFSAAISSKKNEEVGLLHRRCYCDKCPLARAFFFLPVGGRAEFGEGLIRDRLSSSGWAPDGILDRARIRESFVASAFSEALLKTRFVFVCSWRGVLLTSRFSVGQPRAQSEVGGRKCAKFNWFQKSALAPLACSKLRR